MLLVYLLLGSISRGRKGEGSHLISQLFLSFRTLKWVRKAVIPPAPSPPPSERTWAQPVSGRCICLPLFAVPQRAVWVRGGRTPLKVKCTKGGQSQHGACYTNARKHPFTGVRACGPQQLGRLHPIRWDPAPMGRQLSLGGGSSSWAAGAGNWCWGVTVRAVPELTPGEGGVARQLQGTGR